MFIRTANGWEAIKSPNIVPCNATSHGGSWALDPKEHARMDAASSRFRRLFETADGSNSLETGRFYHLSHDPRDLH